MTKLLGCSRQGGISSEQLPSLLTQLSPGLNVDENVLSRIISQNNKSGKYHYNKIIKQNQLNRIFYKLRKNRIILSEKWRLLAFTFLNSFVLCPLPVCQPCIFIYLAQATPRVIRYNKIIAFCE